MYLIFVYIVLIGILNEFLSKNIYFLRIKVATYELIKQSKYNNTKPSSFFQVHYLSYAEELSLQASTLKEIFSALLINLSSGE